MGDHQKLQNLRVIIVGGSIAGLFTGIVLSSLARVKSVTILERYQEQQQKDQGAGIRLSGDVLKTITKYTGLRPEDYCALSRRLKLLGEKGEVRMERTIEMWTTSWSQFSQALMKKFEELGQQEDQYWRGCYVRNLVERDDYVEVQFTRAGHSETVNADLVIGADGISSTLRQLLAPETKRTYAGYAILRGLVLASDLSSETLAVHHESGVFNHSNAQFISYWVPKGDGPINESNKLFNWGWYTTYSEEDLKDIMTDCSGSPRAYTLPQGAMRREVADKIRARARRELPPSIAEPIERTKEPFVQVITDSTAPENIFLNGKVILIGDAVAAQRPHTASSCTQCTFHTLLLESYLKGNITLEQMSQQALEFSNILVDAAKELGSYTQSTELTPAEKDKAYLGAWFPIQAKLSMKFNEYANIDGPKT